MWIDWIKTLLVVVLDLDEMQATRYLYWAEPQLLAYARTHTEAQNNLWQHNL